MISWKAIFGKINNSILFIFVILFFFFSETIAKDNKILLKVNNEIITSIDILKEIEYLSIINDQFKKTEKKLQIKIAKNSLIKEKIKVIELQKYNQSLKINEKLLEEVVIRYFSDLNINSLSEFELFFKNNKIETSFVKKKVSIETLWNQLIYNKFQKNVKINQDEIKNIISSKKVLKEYLLSELVMSVDKNDDLIKKIELVKNTISEKSFSEAALIYSNSVSAKKGGKLGWIKEDALNDKIKRELNLISINKYTNPIVIPGGLLILKIDDVREIDKKINIENEIKIIINKKTNDQLNRFSTLYLNKIKKNIFINEI